LLKRLDINGNPFIGVLCRASDALAVASSEISDDERDEFCECLGVPVMRATIGGSHVVGALCALNSRGVVVSELASNEELEQMRHAAAGADILRLSGKLNALGNNILVNDHAALINPDMSKTTMRKIADFLGVEVARGTIAGVRTVGSAAAVNSRGLLCHPRVTAPERKALAELFRLPVTVGTANYGSPMIGACLAANSKGAAAGSPSTGIEMGRIEEGLGFI
jgi:translation initiation factor 6